MIFSMKSRLTLTNICLITLSGFVLFFLGNCAGVTPEPEEEKPAVSTKNKRGFLKGPQYFNEYYKFQITTPRGWRAMRPQTDFLVRMSSIQSNVKIEVAVSEFNSVPDLEAEAKKLIKEKAFEIISQEPRTILDQAAMFFELQSTTEAVTKKVTVLYIQKDTFLYQIYSSGPRDKFDEFSHSIDETLNSFLFSDKFVEGFGRADYFTYLVKPDDTLKRLATRWLNDPKQDKTIAYFNQITALVAYRPIDIPCSVAYEIQEGDTPVSISQKFYNTPDRFNLIPPYNPLLTEDKILQPGTKIKVPMYFIYKVQQDDSLAKIAQKFLRSEKRAELIHIYNGGDTIRVGQKIKIPLLWRLREFVIYTVKANDSLGSIAIEMTGSKNNYPVIAEFNNIPPPFELSIGQKIKIPKDIIKIMKKRPPKKPVKKEKEEEIEGPLYDVDDIEGPIYEPN
ncbi:LysM peptidoglycan-binding domain-containing protein [candidate division CSSED10-310 bacterium]|uniref:LysM peptidoglycan-binding domain-containing protein n=1 Tax=candidate division CSSED10-310 bacterium TaxID=2855610 RepID=A0ABV6YRI5_UNCC1